MIRIYANRGENTGFCSRNDHARIHVQNALLHRQGQTQPSRPHGGPR